MSENEQDSDILYLDDIAHVLQIPVGLPMALREEFEPKDISDRPNGNLYVIVTRRFTILFRRRDESAYLNENGSKVIPGAAEIEQDGYTVQGCGKMTIHSQNGREVFGFDFSRSY